MISVSRLLCGMVTEGDSLRYFRDPEHAGANQVHRPIVVWNSTRRCNLHCVHCYAGSKDQQYQGELSFEEGKRFIDGLAEFKVPVLLFSGGEPLMRERVFDLARYAKSLGLRIVLSTNGTLISPDVAKEIKQIGFAEAGISLDGIGERNDRFRGQPGAFEGALGAIRNCLSIGQKVSVRFTITGRNYMDIPQIFDLAEKEGVPRLCFYHLAYVGRGDKMQGDDLGPAETRKVVDYIFDRTVDMHARGYNKEVLTVDNHADGAYLYMRLMKDDPGRAPAVLDLLRRNGGNNSGIRIGAVDNLGNVHADQFWWHYSFGNVKERKFGDIWQDLSDPVMRGLKDRKGMLKGRCARCRFIDICGGNLRVRAESVHNDIWADDPACYLTDEEIGLAAARA
ncbi:MAG: radical SAM protein [Chloroflexi bacterium]|nr:radical SAM protein [Chloroflexota bacterium]